MTGQIIIIFLGGAFAMLIFLAVVYLIIRPGSQPPDKGGLFFEVVFNNQKFKVTSMDFKNTEFVLGEVKALDAKGDTAQIQEGSVTASSSNEEVATTEVDEDGKIKVIGQRAGVAIITIGADADLGEGVKNITTEVAVNVTSSEAVGLGVTFGEPQPQV